MDHLIDPACVRQSGMGVEAEQLPPSTRSDAAFKAVVLRVYPVGHPANRVGQTLVDIQPLADFPVMMSVPIASGHAHQETDVAAAESPRRQPYAPKPRARIEGMSRDLRPGTFVWVQFQNGSIWDPVVIGTAKFNDQGAAGFPLERQIVDRIASDGKRVIPTEVHPLDSALGEYPRAVDVFNGTRVETTNTGSRYVQTSIDREPVFPGHNGIPQSPDPSGSYGVSTRGARRGHIGFTTGRHPETGDESGGRQFRQSLEAEDGTIRDSTRSKIGNLIQRLKSDVGRLFASTRGSGDGRVYLEGRDRAYVSLDAGRAELHGPDEVVLDGPKVRLGGAAAAYELTLWPQLIELLDALALEFDLHTHLYIPGTEEPTQTNPPTAAHQQLTVATMKDACKADEVKAGQTPPTAPTHQDDPDGDG